MKKHISSLLFALAFFGTMGHAQEAKRVDATITYDPAMLETETGAQDVMLDIKRQSVTACRSVSLISVGFTVDEDCVDDMVGQAVAKINDEKLQAQYAEADVEAAAGL